MNIWQNKEWGPMLLKEVPKPFTSPDYIFEIKFDGIRAIIFASPKKIIVKTRNKQDISYLFPELQEIKYLVKSNTIFDGEIVAFQSNLPSFSKLQERMHLKNPSKIKMQSIENPIVFICFDILYQNKNLCNLSLLARKDILSKIKDNDVFVKNKYINEKGKELFKYTKSLGLEGIVAKKIDSIYEANKRTSNWIKIKNIKMGDFIIGGYINNKNNTISLVLGEKNDNKLYYVGKVVVSKNNDIVSKLKPLKNNKSPFIDYNEKSVNYIHTEILCEIEYLEKTKNNHLRHPVFRKIR